MIAPLDVYLDSVDADARDKAESGDPVYPRRDFPVLPMVVPWAIGLPVAVLLPSTSPFLSIDLVGALFASFAFYWGVGLFYWRRVKRYRAELGTER